MKMKWPFDIWHMQRIRCVGACRDVKLHPIMSSVSRHWRILILSVSMSTSTDGLFRYALNRGLSGLPQESFRSWKAQLSVWFTSIQPSKQFTASTTQKNYSSRQCHWSEAATAHNLHWMREPQETKDIVGAVLIYCWFRMRPPELHYGRERE